jgi:hypothetical protein
VSVRHDWDGELPLPSKEVFTPIPLIFLNSTFKLPAVDPGIWHIQTLAASSSQLHVVHISYSIFEASHLDVRISTLRFYQGAVLTFDLVEISDSTSRPFCQCLIFVQYFIFRCRPLSTSILLKPVMRR